jgi:putative peptidoglycan lipid II flippase
MSSADPVSAGIDPAALDVTVSEQRPIPAASSARLARSAGVIGIATMGSRVLGLARDQVLAYLFGAGMEMDAFNVAFRIPNLLRDLFAEGAMSAAFVPTFTRRLTLHGKPSAWSLGNQVVTALVIVTGVLVALGIVFARPLVTAYAESYASIPGKLELTVSLTRVMLPVLALVAVAAACMGMLNSLQRFFVPALSPAMFNVATIICAIALVPVMPAWGLPRIMAIAIGTLLGGIGQIALQWPVLRREGFRYRPLLNIQDEGLREVLILMGPGTIGLAAVQINLFVNTMLATSEPGAVSWLNYAFRVMYLPIGLFGVSIATATLPAISRHAAHDDRRAMRGTIANSLIMMMMLNVPATLGLIALASPIVALLFERGSFHAADTAATAGALRFYAPGLLGYSAVKLAVPSFYALHESRTPVIVSALTVVVNLILNLTLVRVLGYRGLALGTALTALLNAGVLLWLLRTRLSGLDGARVARAFLKIVAAAVVMAVAAVWIDRWVYLALPYGILLRRLISVTAAIGGGVLTLAIAARALRIDEFLRAIELVTAKVVRRPGRS